MRADCQFSGPFALLLGANSSRNTSDAAAPSRPLAPPKVTLPSSPLPLPPPFQCSNVFEELDEAGEYFFDPASRNLYVFYNASAGTPPPADWRLVVSQLEVFFNATGTSADPVSDVTFEGLSFRDQRTAQLDPWVDPSGGDWGLRRAGLLHFEGTHRATVSSCTFYRTDANAVFLAAYNRNATVQDCEFAYTGFSAVVTFGSTLQDDATNGEQPWGTVIAYNVVHEIGTYQLQSSGWFTSRAALTRAEGNVIFNIPRAGINFNDGCGGGDNVSHCSIFNTCRQSGDHGPMNSWNRMPFLTRIRSLGGEASYASADTETSHSMIIANYGASQVRHKNPYRDFCKEILPRQVGQHLCHVRLPFTTSALAPAGL